MFNAYKETLTVNVLINKCYSFCYLVKYFMLEYA